MYKQITIEHLRGIQHLHIADFRQINLFVGKNNCGKTTILEAIFLLSGPTNANLPLSINQFRNFPIINEHTWRLIFNKFDTNINISLSGEIEKNKEKRHLIIKPKTKEATTSAKPIATTTILDTKGSYSEDSSEIDGLVLEYSFSEAKQDTPKKITTWVEVVENRIQITPPKNYKEHLKSIYSNQRTMPIEVSDSFHNIQIAKRTERVLKVLRRIEPSIESISLGLDGVVYCDIGFDKLIPINVMGDGMFRLLSIILTITRAENGVALVDEIENGFHYSSQGILWDAILALAKEFNVQIFATTHSIECVKAFSHSFKKVPDHNDDIRLFRIERDNKDFRAVGYNYNELEAAIESEWEVR